MSSLGPEVLVQYPRDAGDRDWCRGITGLPVSAPAQIAILPTRSTRARELAQDLGAELVASTLRAATGTSEVRPPCGGLCVGITNCYARRNPACRRVLILLGEGGDPSLPPSGWRRVAAAWRAAGGVVVPLLPAGANPGKWLPPGLALTNNAFWHRSPRECIPSVLSSAGIVPDEWRVFISYRRRHSAAIAEQLFDTLSHRGWNVFLDRFQIPVGIDFRARLADELRDKTMIVFLETEDFLDSDWTKFEVATARRHRLWMVPVTLPNGQRLRGLAGTRIVVNQAGVTGSGETAKLSDMECARVVDHLVEEHTRGVLWRKAYMDGVVRDSLTKVGVPFSASTEPGRIEVPLHNTYVIRTSLYPPGVKEFIESDRGRLPPPGCNVLVGPVTLREVERVERIRWLGEKADIRVISETATLRAARAIQKGNLK